MKNTKPFIKKFEADSHFYVYDVNTNQIIQVEQNLYHEIDQFTWNTLDNSNIEAHLTALPVSKRKWQKDLIQANHDHGLFSASHPKKITLGVEELEHIKYIQEDGISQLILEVTSNCNLNCQYCQVSGKYQPPTESQSVMSWATMQKTLDFFSSDLDNTKDAFISFYGGEPLLNFETIKKAVEYCAETYPEYKYRFSMATNGVLLTPEKLDFLIQHNFRLRVSLDGPQEIHDRYRISVDGKPSFKTILSNLESIKQNHNEYFENNISFTCVLAPPFDAEKIFDFFFTHDLLSPLAKKGKLRASLLDTRQSTFVEDFELEESIREFADVFDIFNRRIEKFILKKQLDRITMEKSTILSILTNLAQRKIQDLHEIFPPMGACQIGMQRLFVSTQGEFYICERDCREFNIGNVDNGLDYDKMLSFYRKMDTAMQECKDCWALIHCDRCWANIGNLDEFNGERKETFCNIQKKVVETAFITYARLLEQDPHCMKIFEGE